MMKICPNCQKEYDNAFGFCVVCGLQLVDFQPDIEEQQPMSADKKICVNCGNEIIDGAAFCTSCGTKIVNVEGTQPLLPEIKCCFNCGNELEDNAAFCTSCGVSVNKAGFNRYNINPVPVGQLKTNKGLLKSLLLSLITFGIYPFVILSSVSNDINVVASRYDGKKTMHFCLLAFIVAPLTLGVGAIVWYHKISARIGAELDRRGIDYSFGAADYWLWNVLGILIVIGPFVYLHKLFKAVNLMNADYNMKG